MILDMKVAGVTIDNGVFQANLQLKTENGVVAIQAAFQLNKHPGLDALVPLIDTEVRKACSHLGLAKHLAAA